MEKLPTPLGRGVWIKKKIKIKTQNPPSQPGPPPLAFLGGVGVGGSRRFPVAAAVPPYPGGGGKPFTGQGDPARSTRPRRLCTHTHTHS